MIKSYIQQLLDDDLDYRVNRSPLEPLQDAQGNDVNSEPELMILDELMHIARDQLVRSDYSDVKPMVEEMLANHSDNGGLEDLQGAEVNSLCHSMLQALPAYYGALRKRAEGVFDHQERPLVPPSANVIQEADQPEIAESHPQAMPVPPSADSASSDKPILTLGQLTADHWEDKEPTWKPRSRTDYLRSKKRLLEYLGEGTDVTTINYNVMKGYRQSIIDTGVSIGTVNFHIGFATQVFNHELKTTGLLHINPASGLKMKDTRRKDKIKPMFSLVDLRKLFVDGPGYKEDSFNHPSLFWVPLISLFCGCRLEETCQLYASQIRKVGDSVNDDDGIWCIVFDEEHDGQSVKSSEKRDIPIHPFLLELGLHRYAQECATERLWPELKRIGNRYGHYIGRVFGNYKKACGLNDKVSFHSFRHTVETELREKDVDGLWIDILTGHSIKGEGRGRYTKRRPSTILEKAVSKLTWDQRLDLKHMKRSKYARP